MRYSPGGASTENQFPDPPEWVPNEKAPIVLPCASVWTEEAPLCRGMGLPPHRIASSSVVFFLWERHAVDMSVGISGRERDRKDAYSHRRLLEAEGKLILYLPHLCLYLQLSFSLGDIVIQLDGFGMGDV